MIITITGVGVAAYTWNYTSTHANTIGTGNISLSLLESDASGYDDIKIPVRATSGSAGYDFYCPCELIIKPGQALVIPTGIRCDIDRNWVLSIYPRSGLTETGWYIPNTPGIGDSGYRGEILVVFRPIDGMDREEFPYKEGDRVAQCQVVKYQEVIWDRVPFLDDLAPSKRGDGGYGSTGKD